MNPFVTFSNACLIILVGQVVMAVCRSGKVTKAMKKGIKQPADHIMDIDMNYVNEVVIPHESKDENDNIDVESDCQEYHSDVEQESNHMIEVGVKMAKQQMMKCKKNQFMIIMDVKENMIIWKMNSYFLH